MRKLAFINEREYKKIMIYESGPEGVYMFYYDTWIDATSTRDDVYATVEEVEALCLKDYNIRSSDWINISAPMEGCQHDFIAPTRVKGRNNDKPEYGKFERLSENGEWYDIAQSNCDLSISELSGNDRLLISGLREEFDSTKSKNDRSKAQKILTSLQWDEKSVNQIIADEF